MTWFGKKLAKKVKKNVKPIIKNKIVKTVIIGGVIGAATGGVGALAIGGTVSSGLLYGGTAGTLSAVANNGKFSVTTVKTMDSKNLFVATNIKGMTVPICKLSAPKSVITPAPSAPSAPSSSSATFTGQKTLLAGANANAIIVPPNKNLIIDKMTTYLSSISHNVPTGYCAKHVRLAIEHGLSLNKDAMVGEAGSAKDFGPVLIKRGFKKMPQGTTVVLGDVIIFGANKHSKHGHIQMLTKNGWVSDFKQKDVYGGQIRRENKHLFELYRLN
jgi:hypothetical protein